MYHEVSEPYAFLWYLRPALRAEDGWWWWTVMSRPAALTLVMALPRAVCSANFPPLDID
jgi:hypothetical protein